MKGKPDLRQRFGWLLWRIFYWRRFWWLRERVIWPYLIRSWPPQ